MHIQTDPIETQHGVRRHLLRHPRGNNVRGGDRSGAFSSPSMPVGTTLSSIVQGGNSKLAEDALCELEQRVSSKLGYGDVPEED